MRSDIKLILVLFIFLIGLTGCLGPVGGEANNIYLLNPTPPSVATGKRSAKTLLVKIPQANSAYNTLQIAYIKNNYELSYYVKSRWATPPPQMLLPLMVKTLQNTHAFRAVIPQSASGNADLILDTQLLQLQQEFITPTSQIRLVMRAELSNANTFRVLATHEFTIVEPATANDPYAGVAAANRAVDRFLQQLAVFCVRYT